MLTTYAIMRIVAVVF